MNNDGGGVSVNSSSSLHLERSLVANNSDVGVSVGSSSDATMVVANIVTNHSHGVQITANSSASIQSSTVTGNYENGVYLSLHSTARLSDGTEIANNSLSGIEITKDSGVELGSGTIIPANVSGFAVTCDGKESSLDIEVGAIIGPVGCIDPDF